MQNPFVVYNDCKWEFEVLSGHFIPAYEQYTMTIHDAVARKSPVNKMLIEILKIHRKKIALESLFSTFTSNKMCHHHRLLSGTFAKFLRTPIL